MKKSRFVLGGVVILLGIAYFLWPPAKLSRDYCAFCDANVINAQKFYEDDDIVALYTHKPVMPGHCLIIPKRHMERFEQVTDQEGAAITQGIKKVDQAVSQVFGTSSYLLLQKNGIETGQTVPHVHFHYMPRKAGETSTLKFLLNMYMANVKGPIAPSQMREVCAQLNEAM